MQITIQINNTHQAQPAAEIEKARASQNTEPVIQLTAEDWHSRQTALHAKVA